MKTVKKHGFNQEALEIGDRVYVEVDGDMVWEIAVGEDGGLQIRSNRGTVVSSALGSNWIELAIRRNDGAEGILVGRGLRSNAGKPDLDTAVRHAEGLVLGIHDVKTKKAELRERIKAGIVAIWPW